MFSPLPPCFLYVTTFFFFFFDFFPLIFSASLHSLSFCLVIYVKLLIYRRINYNLLLLLLHTTQFARKSLKKIIRTIYYTTPSYYNKITTTTTYYNPDFKTKKKIANTKKIHAEVFILVKKIITFRSPQF